MRILKLFVLFCFAFQYSDAQVFRTGDVNLDAALRDFNIHSKTDFSLFKKKISVDFGLSEGRIDHLLLSYKMEPADLLLVLETSRHCSKPVEKVIECYEGNKGHGWGQIAKDLGIKPGSPEFHAMKKDLKYKCKADKYYHGNGTNQGHSKGKGKGKGKKM
ncbi:hypothetical protein GM18_3543 [Sporocytophaga myxococcoides]|uniref:Uncharacterized protein n=1 Tax=Sporocytophaga myxococcoides TaxID=153721 RepID=A0A098L8B8_9BACT|nr:hypothetical protein [Sporocytophaga myxococcoides]GAL82906.1 hypothetical protein GM18_3543 [Sporocytophaga myxococcoides]